MTDLDPSILLDKPSEPAGTARKSFWQRTGTIVAITATIALFQYVTRPYLVSWIGDAGAVLAEAAEWAWAAAFGVNKAAPGLRRT